MFNQSEECSPADHVFFELFYYRIPHDPLQVRTHSFEGISPPWPPLPGKAIKLFFPTSPSSPPQKKECKGDYKLEIDG